MGTGVKQAAGKRLVRLDASLFLTISPSLCLTVREGVAVAPVENREIRPEKFPGLEFDDRLLHRNRPAPQPVIAEEPRLVLAVGKPLRARRLERRLKLLSRHFPRAVSPDERIEHDGRRRGSGLRRLPVRLRRQEEEGGELGYGEESGHGIWKAHGLEGFRRR